MYAFGKMFYNPLAGRDKGPLAVHSGLHFLDASVIVVTFVIEVSWVLLVWVCWADGLWRVCAVIGLFERKGTRTCVSAYSIPSLASRQACLGFVFLFDHTLHLSTGYII